MKKNRRLLVAALVVAVAVTASLVLWSNQSGSSQPKTSPVTAATMATDVASVESAIRASEPMISDVSVQRVADVVILKGTAPDRATAERAGAIARGMGMARLANLVRVSERADDQQIVRAAERQIALNRALDDCTFRLTSTNGVLSVRARVRSAAQEDAAKNILRRVEGVRRVVFESERI